MAKKQVTNYEILPIANGYLVRRGRPYDGEVTSSFAFESFDGLVVYLRENLPAPGEAE